MQKKTHERCFTTYGEYHITISKGESRTYLTVLDANVSIRFFLRCLTMCILVIGATQFHLFSVAADNFDLQRTNGWSRWREMNWQTTEYLDAVQFLCMVLTKTIHFRLLFTASGLGWPKKNYGIVWIQIPFFSSFVLLHPYTRHFCTISLRNNSCHTKKWLGNTAKQKSS